jgi:hypothetical protein
MDYELGLRTLKARLVGDALGEFNVYEARLLENLRREQMFGSTETTRAERAAVVDALNRLAQAHLGTSFNALCQPAAAPVSAAPGPRGSGKPAERELASLRIQLEEARENLRLIRERKSQFVMETDVPLDLIKRERRLEEQIAEIEARLAALGETVAPAGVPGHGAGGTTIITGGGAVILGDVKVEHGDFVGRDKVVRSERDDQ